MSFEAIIIVLKRIFEEEGFKDLTEYRIVKLTLVRILRLDNMYKKYKEDSQHKNPSTKRSSK